jgi:membrane-associated phospholipid phosphatase
VTTIPKDPELARRHPKTYLGLHGVVGLVLAIACVWIFVALADEIPEKGWMARVDTNVTGWLQAHGTETGESVFSVVSLLGAQVLSVLLVAVAVILLVRRDWRHLAMLAVTCGGGALLNLGLKQVFRRQRPSFASEFSVTSWSFPSGHAMDSLIVYGMLAYWLADRFPSARRAIAAAAVALIALIGFSRVYLGVHYLSDVIAGYTAGSIWLLACINAYRFAERRRLGPSGADEA